MVFCELGAESANNSGARVSARWCCHIGLGPQTDEARQIAEAVQAGIDAESMGNFGTQEHGVLSGVDAQVVEAILR